MRQIPPIQQTVQMQAKTAVTQVKTQAKTAVGMQARTQAKTAAGMQVRMQPKTAVRTLQTVTDFVIKKGPAFVGWSFSNGVSCKVLFFLDRE